MKRKWIMTKKQRESVEKQFGEQLESFEKASAQVPSGHQFTFKVGDKTFRGFDNSPQVEQN